MPTEKELFYQEIKECKDAIVSTLQSIGGPCTATRLCQLEPSRDWEFMRYAIWSLSASGVIERTPQGFRLTENN